VVPRVPSSAIGTSPVTGMPPSYRWIHDPLCLRSMCTRHSLSVMLTPLSGHGGEET
jgi:hypothetical protein